MIKLETFLPYRLARIAEAVSQEIRPVYKDIQGLNRPEWRVLASLAEIGPATATQIGTHSTQHKTKVSRAVFKLEERRWLTRETVTEDRRNEMLTLTALGKSAHSALAKPMQKAEEDILIRLTDEERRRLLRALDALEAAVLKRPASERQSHEDG